MKKRLTLFAVLAALSMASAPRASARDPDPPELGKVIFDRARFLKSLPPKTLIYPGFMLEQAGAPVSDADFWAAMKKLGSVPAVTFLELPDEVTRPRVLSSVEAKYPPSRAYAEQSGHVDFLVLIGRTGRVAALYCAGTSDDSFAVFGAEALVKWAFLPATFQGTAVPVLVLVRLEFKVVRV